MGENKFRKPFTPEGIGNNIDVPKTYRNFRDMGGLSCDGGYRIKEHIIYRTEAMHARTQEEKTFIENLGLDVMIDFRSTLTENRIQR